MMGDYSERTRKPSRLSVKKTNDNKKIYTLSDSDLEKDRVYNRGEEKLNKVDEFQSIASHIAPRMGEVLRKKSGFDARLLENWPQIVGGNLSEVSIPFKIKRRPVKAGDEAPAATLTIACEGFAAVKIQHQADEIIKKINALLGGQVIDKIKIVQKPLCVALDPLPITRPLTQRQLLWLEEQGEMIEDEVLRASIRRLGKNLIETTRLP